MNAAALSAAWHLDHMNRRLWVDGHDWSYVDTETDGPAIVLLPGSLGTHEVFYHQIAALGHAYRIVAATYPGCDSPDELASGLGTFVRALGVGGALIAGSSYAAYWLQIYAVEFPERAHKLVLGNGFTHGEMLRWHPLFAEELIEGSPARMEARWREAIGGNPPSCLRDLQLDMLGGRQPIDVLRARLLAAIHARERAAPQLPGGRLTVLDCADDPIISPEARAAFAGRYPQATHITLPVGGHYPHVLNPDSYNDLLRRSV
ncbi:hypothetical protein R69746_07848 [Paraburkholderia aspalathi]|uniref:alpha/beta fold hydrolase n=1 Tax=Paraburkholderia aspalathi TaxID=1324617 RepID=UPI00190DD262|nr:alpha/beta hydrolase [Paraburkholderia aspalathi]MBK3843821.1 alpha/beta hydrolase [Paraburkholderia aspalathi]CAE6861636.1 hypothetical protein R69746_07848 [Paraburkholderia aspalathi]CAE6869310.1 hypothetical protein R75465_08175 [Paraburkholderia aspalathi]